MKTVTVFFFAGVGRAWNIAALVLPLFLFVGEGVAARSEISPAEVYVQAERIYQELELLNDHIGKNVPDKIETFQARLKPRHVWQKSYVVLVKINIFRQLNNMPRITPNSIEPVLNLEPTLVYGQTQRILTELAIIKRHLDLGKEVKIPPLPTGIKSIDVFNKLHAASMELEELNEQEIDPPHVFAEVMRLYKDVSSLLRQLGIKDDTYPPARKSTVTPADSLQEVFVLMAEIQRIQRFAGIEHTNFNPFRKQHDVRPSDVFNMVSMSLAEFQLIKAYSRLTRITLAAEYLDGKSPADVYQLLQWITRKLRLIDANRIRG
jgi:hypothetical protein